MKLIYIILFIFLINTASLVAQTISVVNIQSLIDNNVTYKNTLIKMEKDREKYLKNFNLKEKELNKIFTDIENSRLILSESETNIQIDNYNIQLNNFTNLVDKFNFHYQNQIFIIRENVLNIIIKLLENYAIKNNIELILDSNTYLIASNSLDITNEIKKELDKMNFTLEYTNFEKN